MTSWALSTEGGVVLGKIRSRMASIRTPELFVLTVCALLHMVRLRTRDEAKGTGLCEGVHVLGGAWAPNARATLEQVIPLLRWVSWIDTYPYLLERADTSPCQETAQRAFVLEGYLSDYLKYRLLGQDHGEALEQAKNLLFAVMAAEYSAAT